MHEGRLGAGPQEEKEEEAESWYQSWTPRLKKL